MHSDGLAPDEAPVRGAERGASLVEYALLLSLIVLVCVGAVFVLGGNVSGGVDRSASSLFVR
jgi:Flp pilus assembly pilin Flp